jgi:hypothetical protein
MFNLDAIGSLNFLFTGGNPPTCSDAADTNDDGRVDISDPVSTLSFLFSGGAPPPSPGAGACGSDPTDDGIACELVQSCD